MNERDQAFVDAHAHAMRQIIAGWAFGVAQMARTQAPVGPTIPADGLVRVNGQVVAAWVPRSSLYEDPRYGRRSDDRRHPFLLRGWRA